MMRRAMEGQRVFGMVAHTETGIIIIEEFLAFIF
jgi:hypothetical protein